MRFCSRRYACARQYFPGFGKNLADLVGQDGEITLDATAKERLLESYHELEANDIGRSEVRGREPDFDLARRIRSEVRSGGFDSDLAMAKGIATQALTSCVVQRTTEAYSDSGGRRAETLPCMGGGAT